MSNKSHPNLWPYGPGSNWQGVTASSASSWATFAQQPQVWATSGIQIVGSVTFGHASPVELDLEESLVAEPVTGLRAWQVARPQQVVLNADTLARMAKAHEEGRNPFLGLLGPRLAAIAGNGAMWDRATLARCNHGSHDAPHSDCSCGLWAIKDETKLMGILQAYNACAYGRVQMWGRIVEHKDGYRAQYAKPIDITWIDGDQETADQLAAFYGCSVKVEQNPTELQVRLRPEQERQITEALKATRTALGLEPGEQGERDREALRRAKSRRHKHRWWAL